MVEQQSPDSSGGGGQGGHTRELTRVGALLLGLALITGAVTDQTVKLSNQILPELPATDVLGLRILVGLVGAFLLLWGLDGLLGRPSSAAVRRLQAWWQRRRLPRPPHRDVSRPPDRNPLFRNREAELEQLRDRLLVERHLDLSGLGGVGKTQLAIEYLHRHHDDPGPDDYPDGVFWLRGETAARLAGDFAGLAWLPELMLPERNEREQGRVIEAVVSWLRPRKDWLLVIDNLDPTAVLVLNHLLGRGLRGHVLVTSRVPVWDPDPLAVKPWPPEVAIPFLIDRSGRQSEEAAAATVVEILGGLPLALVQAAGYMKTTGCGLASYAELLRTRLAEVLREGRPQDYPLAVAATWQLSFERIEREQRAAAALLRLCAFLAADDIPLGLLGAGAGEMPRELRRAAADEVRLGRAIAELLRYGLVDRQADGLSVHRLVQVVVRDSMRSDLRQRWLSAAARALRKAFPTDVDDPANWPLCARLLPHAETAIALIGERMVEPGVISQLMDRLATYLQDRAEYAPARPLFERALAIREQERGPVHPETATSLNNLAGLLRDQGELAAARPLVERALAIRERVLGPVHPETATSLNNLATLLADQGELAAAQPLVKRGLAIRERVLGPDHPDTARSLNNVAMQLRDQGELGTARPLFERALAIYEQVLGPNHPETAMGLNNLAALLSDQGELAAAQPLYERALAIRERVLGPDHPDTAGSLNNLAMLLRAQRQFAAARRLFERALVIYERVLGTDHPTTITVRRNLGAVLVEIGGAGSRPASTPRRHPRRRRR